jgi:hypothetical protein
LSGLYGNGAPDLDDLSLQERVSTAALPQPWLSRIARPQAALRALREVFDELDTLISQRLLPRASC